VGAIVVTKTIKATRPRIVVPRAISVINVQQKEISNNSSL
jgi:hypothetical protein